jgi:hypothetical protein
MTQEEVIQGNILITEFDKGLVYNNNHTSLYPDGAFYKKDATLKDFPEYTMSMIQYHTSWDWLMPVWRKCIDIIGLWAHTHEDDNKSKVWLKASDNIRVALTSADITKAHREISSLIQWYNTQTQQHGTTI